MKTGNPPISNDERIAWLAERADYLEHRDAAGEEASAQPGESGYWLNRVTEDNWTSLRGCSTKPECCGLSIVEYIDLMIRRDREAAARNALEEFSHDD